MASVTVDVLVAGGAVTGSSVAFHLAADPAFGGTVLVAEPDPTYARAATALSAGSIRQQFSSAINVAVSLHGIAFLRRAHESLAVEGELPPELGLREGGYLYLATTAGRATLAENHGVQTAMGADIEWLEPAGLSARFPWLSTDGLAAGTWGRTGEGWFDGYGLMAALRAKARSLGVAYRRARVVELVTAGARPAGASVTGARVTGARLDDGTEVRAGTVVVAAGAGSRALAASAGVDLPVDMGKRHVFAFTCPTPLAGFPLLIDPSGVWCRPDGPGYIAGLAPPDDDDPDAPDDFAVDRGWFDERIWPVLAARIPAFDALRVRRAWAGHYDMNRFDHNALLGPVPGLDGVLVASGFSGHGLQQSPAVGRGLAELVVHGRYVTLDLSPLGYERYPQGRPLLERNIV